MTDTPISPDPEKTPDPVVEPDAGTTEVPGPLTEEPEDFPEADADQGDILH